MVETSAPVFRSDVPVASSHSPGQRSSSIADRSECIMRNNDDEASATHGESVENERFDPIDTFCNTWDATHRVSAEDGIANRPRNDKFESNSN